VSNRPFNRDGDGRPGATRRSLARQRHELMPLSAFHDQESLPTDAGVRHVLGDAHATWELLLGLVAERIGPVSEVWKCTSVKTGWGLRVVRETKVILYMTPQPRQFVVSFALGERAVKAARMAKLSAAVMQVIEAAPGFVDGRRVRITVRDARDLETLAQLAAIKCELSR
jgi:hypothetical protein